MKTYRLQVAVDGGWLNVEADDGTPLEFIFRSHAVFVARALREVLYKHTDLQDHWRTVSSKGEYLPLLMDEPTPMKELKRMPITSENVQVYADKVHEAILALTGNVQLAEAKYAEVLARNLTELTPAS